jgi:hypothetical protein
VRCESRLTQVAIDHVTIYRWVQTFTREFIDAARPSRHASGDRWFVDEAYVKVAGPLDLPVPGGRPSTGRSSTSCCPNGATARPAGRCSPALGPLRATGMQFALPLCEMWHSTQAVGSSATSTRPGPAAHAVGPDAAAVQRIGCFANGVSTTGLGRPGLNRR